jgi:hypothetical protein
MGYATAVSSGRSLGLVIPSSRAFHYVAANEHADNDTIAAFRPPVPQTD